MPGKPPTGIPAHFEPVVPVEESFDAVYGLELVDDGSGDGTVRARVAIRDDLRGQGGLVHGGVISTVAEAVASRGTWLGAGEGMAVMGMSNDTHFLRPFRDGHVNVVALARHRGPAAWLWEVQARDDAGRLCAITMVNIAIRPARAR